jgi:phenylalanyl-tRNA synthetase beta chain
MRFSYKELSEYFIKPLPPIRELEEKISTTSFEVEGFGLVDDDVEIKVLPDRASDAKKPLGMARELSSALDLPLKPEFIVETTAENARAKINFSVQIINNLIGTKLSEAEIVATLKRVRVEVEKGGDNLVALIPAERVDLNIKEDLADEVARIYGYNNVPAQFLTVDNQKNNDHPDFILANQLREFFVPKKFTEVYGYTFTNQGVMEVEKPLAGDKAFLRTNLADGMIKMLTTNAEKLLFNDQPVKLFEVGNVFPSVDTEEKRLCFGIAYTAAKFDKSEAEVKALAEELGLTAEIKQVGTLSLVEVKLADLTKFIGKNNTQETDLKKLIPEKINYQPFSVYPRIIRDLALFVPASISPEEVSAVIEREMEELVTLGPILFDEFTKDGKKSLAFRLIFQASDRTLSDEEINPIMDKIILALNANPDWQVR